MTRNQHTTQHNKLLRSLEKKYVGAVYAEIRKQFNSFLISVDQHGFDYAKRHLNTIIKVDGVVGVIRKLYRTGAYMAAKSTHDGLIKSGFRVKRVGGSPVLSVGFDQIADVVDGYFKIYQFNKSGIPIGETTKKYIQDHLISLVDGGMSYEDAVKNFRQLALDSGPGDTSISKSRAAMIVGTEGTRALSFGGLIGAYMSGVDVDKEWVTSGDHLVRGLPNYPAKFSHVNLDRQATSIFGAFNNGEKIKFPGDPDASKGNTIRCRCSNFFTEKAKPQPRITTRSILNFLTDFFIGFSIGTAVEAAVQEVATDE